MSIQQTQSILILEDDDTFRSFIAGLLQSRGIDVIEASSVREATDKLSSANPLLAIVDYRLPESDGITWITKLREQGRNFPIVFLSGNWCDEKTFDWLRNILRVSLILQKPLLPDLFLQQIESLLPKDFLKHETNKPLGNQSSRGAITSSLSQAKIAPVDIATNRQIDFKTRMAVLRKNYASELSQSWQELTKAVNLIRESPANALDKAQAVHIAHKIRGTAGSVGFTEAGEIAGKLEDLLRGLDLDDPLREVVWSEILRALAAGDESVKAIVEKVIDTDSSTDADDQKRAPLHKLLIVGNKVDYSQYLPSLSKTFSIEIEIIDSVLSVRSRLKNLSKPYDAAIFDMDCIGTKQNLFDLAKDIRIAHGHKCIPLSVVSQQAIKPEDLLYAGISVMIGKDSLKEELQTAIGEMFSAIQCAKPRILLVDDDEILAKFLNDLLSSAGMIVQTLHKPIKIISAVESFKPDLILLDVIMPGLSGYDVCRILRATENWQQLPVLFLTSQIDQASRAAAFQAGGSDFLCKPVLTEEVLARVKVHLQTNVMKQQSLRDELTGLLTSNSFISAATDALKKAESERQSFTLCLISLENFVKFSVQHGWYPMQQVLSTLGELLRNHFKADDLRGRLADDTFALAFSENKDTVEKIMTRLRNEFANIKFPSDSVGHFKTIFNVGLAEYPSDDSTINVLLKAANQRLMDSKLSPMR